VEFKINFRTPKYTDSIMEEPPGEVGLDMVDYIREELKQPNLPLGVIYGFTGCPLDRHLLTVVLPEGDAREIAMFAGRNAVFVEIPPLFFTKYQEPVLNREYTGIFKNKIKYVSYQILFDIQEIVKDWKAAGCPLRWGF